MITANEVRIGNWIADECEPYHFQVEELRKYVGDSIWAFYRKGSIKAKEITPIPLTEEWLKRFGFDTQDWIISHNDTYFNLFKEGNNYFFTADQHHHNSQPFQFVHQLQNIFHSITQTELTLSNP
jgi:hypothetical protein